MIAAIVFVLKVFLIVLALQAVISWFPHKPHHVLGRVHGAMYRLTQPVLRPFRKVLPPVAIRHRRIPKLNLVVDFAVLVVMLLISMVAIPVLGTI